MKKGWSGGKIAAVIAGGFAAVIILFIAFVASVFHLSEVLATISDEDYQQAFSEDFDEPFDEDEASDPVDEEDDRKSVREKRNSRREKDGKSDAGSEKDPDFYEDEYYEFGNALTEGLSYEVSFEEYERNDFLEGEEGAFLMMCNYPVITGDVPNLEGINQAVS